MCCWVQQQVRQLQQLQQLQQFRQLQQLRQRCILLQQHTGQVQAAGPKALGIFVLFMA